MNVSDLPARLAAKIQVADSGCWEWQGARSQDGYGRVTYERKWSSTHRLAYTLLVADIPDGLTVDHLCRNRGCANPAHMRVVTRSENAKGSGTAIRNREATHCPRNHAYEGHNVYWHPNGQRVCRTCQNASARRYSARKRAQAVAS